MIAPEDLPLKTFSTAELCDLIPGITPRQVQFWDETHLVMPRHVGHRRIYHFEQALQVAIIADLRHKGLSLQRIAVVLRAIQRELGKIENLPTAEPAYLAVTKKSVVIETNPARLLERLVGSMQHSYLVNIQECLAILTPEPPKKAFRQSG